MTNNALRDALAPVRHGLLMGLLALLLGGGWAGYMATHHESLHGAFEQQEVEAVARHARDELEMTTMDLGNSAHDAGAPHEHGADGSGTHMHGGRTQHSHSGSLAGDAMQRLLRGHIHFMGIGLLTIVALLLVAATSLPRVWKGVFGWTFGLGALLYPPSWIIMGFRTVTMGSEGAEASVMWLFGPAVALLLGSLAALVFLISLGQFRQRG